MLMLRFVHPPFSALMVERRIASWFSHETYTSRHTWVSLEDISPSMGVAVIAAEDQNFAEHFGFDWNAIEKAYAHKPSSKLRPSEAALLAAVLPNPHKYRVDAPSAYVRGRQAWILGQMGQLGGEQVVKDLGN